MNKLKIKGCAILCILVFILVIAGCRQFDVSTITRIEDVRSTNSGNIHILQNKQSPPDERLRNMLLSYISSPGFSNPDLIEQITGTKAEIQMLNLSEGLIYLSVPEKYYTQEMLKKLTISPDFVEFGTTARGELTGRRIELGNYTLRKPGNYFLRFPSEDFRIDKADIIKIPYTNIQYTLTLQELKGYFYNNSLYGGRLRALTKIDRQGRHIYITNYGALVAKKGERSLQRLVHSLTAGADSKEKKAQLLLDFVTKEIEYDHAEAHSGRNVIKRPNEVLMTKRATCGGKVILYASLLEQLDIDYKFLYYDRHISVCVEGDYVNRNGLTIKIRDKTYAIAETTAPGFQIGSTRLKDNPGIKKVKYIQRPAEDAKIYDVKTGDALPFG